MKTKISKRQQVEARRHLNWHGKHNVKGCRYCRDRIREDREAQREQNAKPVNPGDPSIHMYRATVEVIVAAQVKGLTPIYGSITSGGKGIIGFKYVDGTEVRPVINFEIVEGDGGGTHDEDQVKDPDISVAEIINRELVPV